jgi:hypothetical protein
MRFRACRLATGCTGSSSGEVEMMWMEMMWMELELETVDTMQGR